MPSGTLSHVLRRTLLHLRSSPATDGDLLDRFLRQSEQAAFAELVRRHGPMVMQVCRRVLPQTADVEDAFQATFIVLAQKAQEFTNSDTVGGWLHGVAYRVALNARKQLNQLRVRERQVEIEAVGAVPGASGDFSSAVDEEIARLPEQYQRPVVLCYLEGKTNREAAVILGCSVKWIEKRLAQARDLLRGRLASRGLVCAAGGVPALLLPEGALTAMPSALTTAVVEAAVSTAPVAASRGGARVGLGKLAGAGLLVVGALLLAIYGLRPDPRWRATLSGHEGNVASLAFSPDGGMLASASLDGVAKLWNASTHRERATLRVELSDRILRSALIAFSPDGTLVAWADTKRGHIALWHAETGELLTVLDRSPTTAVCLGFKGRGTHVAAIFWNARIAVWDTRASTAVPAPLPPFGRVLPSAALTPDGKTAALAMWRQLLLREVASGQERRLLDLPEHGPEVIAKVLFSTDGQVLACATTQHLTLWDWTSGTVRARWELPAEETRALAFSPDGRTLISGQRDGTVYVWDAVHGTLRDRIAAHSKAVSSLAIASDNQTLATGGLDQVIHLWDLGVDR